MENSSFYKDNDIQLCLVGFLYNKLFSHVFFHYYPNCMMCNIELFINIYIILTWGLPFPVTNANGYSNSVVSEESDTQVLKMFVAVHSQPFFPFRAAETNSRFQLVLTVTFYRSSQPLPMLLFLTWPHYHSFHVILTCRLRTTTKKTPDHSIQLWMSAVSAEVVRSTCHEGAWT